MSHKYENFHTKKTGALQAQPHLLRAVDNLDGIDGNICSLHAWVCDRHMPGAGTNMSTLTCTVGEQTRGHLFGR